MGTKNAKSQERWETASCDICAQHGDALLQSSVYLCHVARPCLFGRCPSLLKDSVNLEQRWCLQCTVKGFSAWREWGWLYIISTNQDSFPFLKAGKKCLAVYQPEEATNFTLAGCVSIRTYRPKYCGVCTDNRCCIPYKSKTISVDFQCPEGPGFSRQVLWINACFCNLSCRNPNDIFADLESYPDFAEIAN